MTDIGDDMTDKWLTVSDAAHVLGVTERTIYRRIKEGKLEVKLEDSKRYIRIDATAIITDEPSDILSKDELIEQLRKENELLRQQIDKKDEQIMALQEQLAEASHRHDTVVMQMTRLLEYHQQPFWRRLFSRKALPPPVDETIVDMEPGHDKSKE